MEKIRTIGAFELSKKLSEGDVGTYYLGQHLATEEYAVIEELYEKYARDDNFEKRIENENKVVDIDRFHFAMNGQWSENKTDVHKIEIDSNLTDWFEGILNHIKKELEYIEVK